LICRRFAMSDCAQWRREGDDARQEFLKREGDNGCELIARNRFLTAFPARDYTPAVFE
jgi:hypothetical protein